MTDFIFKTLDIADFEKIKEEIAVFNQTMPSDPGRFNIIDNDTTLSLLPSIVKWFEENNLEVKQIAYISVGPNTVQQAHIDSGEPSLALNFPVINCEHVITQFLEFIKEDLTIQYTLGTNLPYYHYNSFDKTIIGELRLMQPTLLNVKMPHRVVNNTNLERISLSFRFKKDPWHLT